MTKRWVVCWQAGAADPVATWDYAYDANNQLLGAKKTVGGTVQKSYRYAYDMMGNRIFAQEDASAVSAAFNNLNQMTAQNQTDYRYAEGVLSEPAIGPVRVNGTDLPTTDGGLTFVGWTEVTTDTLSISAEDAAGNAISEQYSYTTTNDGETLAVEYDDNGNTTRVVTVAADGLSTTTRTFEWDGNDRMRTITYDDGSRTEFEYDYMGRRVQIREYGANQVLDSRQELIWDGLRIAKITDFDNPVTTYDFHFPQGQARTITFPGGSSGSDYLYTRDHLGSVREVVDAADGSLEARYDYTPWGERTQTAGAVKVDFAFTGHHYHEKSGLHLAPYREYSAKIGRWMSRDPIQEAGGINVYQYVDNQPVNYIDPKGLKKKNCKGLEAGIQKVLGKVVNGPDSKEWGSLCQQLRNMMKSYRKHCTGGANGIGKYNTFVDLFNHRCRKAPGCPQLDPIRDKRPFFVPSFDDLDPRNNPPILIPLIPIIIIIPGPTPVPSPGGPILLPV